MRQTGKMKKSRVLVIGEKEYEQYLEFLRQDGNVGEICARELLNKIPDEQKTDKEISSKSE